MAGLRFNKPASSTKSPVKDYPFLGPMDEDERKHEYVPTEKDEARDNRIYQVEALAAELSHSAPNARYSTLQSVAWEILEGNITHKEGIDRLTSKKIVIKKR